MNPDLWILDHVFEPLARTMHKATGINNYTASKWLFMLSTGLFVVMGFIGYNQYVAGAAILWLETYYAWPAMSMSMRLEREWTGTALPPNLRTPKHGSRENRIVEARIGLLALPLIYLFVLWLFRGEIKSHASTIHLMSFSFALTCFGGWLMLLASFYFLACTPPPPKREVQKIGPRGTAVPVTS